MPSRVSGFAGDLRLRLTIASLVVIAALYQCFWNLAGSNITGDENIYLRSGWQYVHGDFTANREHPPTAKYLFGLVQLLTGQGPIGPRVLVGVLTFAVGVVLYLWLRREIGYWGALLAASLWWLTPRGGAGARVDRLALLDPVMTAFAVFAIVAAWWWIRSERAWWLAPVSGVLMAASVTSKLSTIVLLPAFLLLPVLFKVWRKGLVGGVLWVAAFTVTFVALYVPMGIRSAIQYMVAFQEGQNTNGHPITIDGQIHTFAPWWASFRFLLDGTGKAMLVVLAIGVLAALVVRADRLVAYVGASLVLLVGFYVVVAKIALPTYYTAWMPFLLVLAAIGFARLATVPPRALTVPVVLVLVATLVVPSFRVSQAVARAHPTGIALLPGYLEDHDVPDGRILFVSATPTLFQPYVGDHGTNRLDRGPYVAIVVGRDQRLPAPEAVTTLLQDDASSFTTGRLDGLRVWVPKDGRIREDNGALTIAR
ncbi:glycosyltransferase family 39 protein [Curtobacterium flaccumfaciens pv. flaccumfaciens]|uniref:ArnT family glycosyltransferase n=1 Tax=Curtobacterium flaccumfaciens TaxID=2035 RepID=UPI00217E382B|nr:glycosyltransferase family 39 protein [Curtobacterium flaccumfaciens]MCS6548543.1 glycosyltransferase family 39 protein [Curtobacterium flaccumfaciens pv. flaccumfaciens]